jgi:hypothetical protein
MSFQAKDSGVLSRQNKVQRLVIPFTIASNATPASKVIACDEPALVFIKTEGLNQITIAAGALETGETLPTLAAATDSTGVINVLVKINEPLVKVMSVKIHSRGATQTAKPGEVLAFTTGSTNSGQSVVANITTAVNLASASIDAVLEVEYITAE